MSASRLANWVRRSLWQLSTRNQDRNAHYRENLMHHWTKFLKDPHLSMIKVGMLRKFAWQNSRAALAPFCAQWQLPVSKEWTVVKFVHSNVQSLKHDFIPLRQDGSTCCMPLPYTSGLNAAHLRYSQAGSCHSSLQQVLVLPSQLPLSAIQFNLISKSKEKLGYT